MRWAEQPESGLCAQQGEALVPNLKKLAGCLLCTPQMVEKFVGWRSVLAGKGAFCLQDVAITREGGFFAQVLRGQPMFELCVQQPDAATVRLQLVENRVVEEIEPVAVGEALECAYADGGTGVEG